MHFFLIVFSLCTDRLETANRQLSSREYDGHEDRAVEGLYASQSESPRLSLLKLVFIKNAAWENNHVHFKEVLCCVLFVF